MDKVWVVTHGKYSDYRIDAIFASEEEAKAFVNGCEKEPAIEEWNLGLPEDKSIWRKQYQVQLDLETGNEALSWGEYGNSESEEILPEGVSDAYESYYFVSCQYPQEAVKGRCVVGRSVISQEHALKLAAELRQSILRETPSKII